MEPLYIQYKDSDPKALVISFEQPITDLVHCSSKLAGIIKR